MASPAEFYEKGWCPDSPDESCFTNLKVDNATHQEFLDYIDNDYICLHATYEVSTGTIGHMLQLFDENIVPTEAEVIAQFYAELTLPSNFYNIEPNQAASFENYRFENVSPPKLGYANCDQFPYFAISWRGITLGWWGYVPVNLTVKVYNGGYDPIFECPLNSTNVLGTCVPDEGWEWCHDIGGEICAIPDPTVPGGGSTPPGLLPLYYEYPIDPITLECPACYTYDAVLELCIYDNTLTGCTETPDCVPIAGCELIDNITGTCDLLPDYI